MISTDAAFSDASFSIIVGGSEVPPPA